MWKEIGPWGEDSDNIMPASIYNKKYSRFPIRSHEHSVEEGAHLSRKKIENLKSSHICQNMRSSQRTKKERQ